MPDGRLRAAVTDAIWATSHGPEGPGAKLISQRQADAAIAVVLAQAAEQIKALNMRATTSGWLSVNDVLAVLAELRGDDA